MQKRISKQIHNSISKRSSSPHQFNRTLAPLEIGGNLYSIDGSNQDHNGSWDQEEVRMQMNNIQLQAQRNHQGHLQVSGTNQLNNTAIDGEKYDTSIVNQTESTNNQTMQFQTARNVGNNLINQDMSLSMIDDSQCLPNKSLLMPSQDIPHDDDQSILQQFSMTMTMP